MKNVMSYKTLITTRIISILINKLHVVNEHETFYLKNVILKLLIKNSNSFVMIIIIKIATITKTKRRYHYSIIIMLILI